MCALHSISTHRSGPFPSPAFTPMTLRNPSGTLDDSTEATMRFATSEVSTSKCALYVSTEQHLWTFVKTPPPPPPLPPLAKEPVPICPCEATVGCMPPPPPLTPGGAERAVSIVPDPTYASTGEKDVLVELMNCSALGSGGYDCR